MLISFHLSQMYHHKILDPRTDHQHTLTTEDRKKRKVSVVALLDPALHSTNHKSFHIHHERYRCTVHITGTPARGGS